MLTREQAIEIATRHATQSDKDYAHAQHDFVPHPWVVDAMMEASRALENTRTQADLMMLLDLHGLVQATFDRVRTAMGPELVMRVNDAEQRALDARRADDAALDRDAGIPVRVHPWVPVQIDVSLVDRIIQVMEYGIGPTDAGRVVTVKVHKNDHGIYLRELDTGRCLSPVGKKWRYHFARDQAPVAVTVSKHA